MKNSRPLVRCSIVNVRAAGQRCGFGEGKTFAEARKDALAIADMYYPGKVLNRDEATEQVHISVEVSL